MRTQLLAALFGCLVTLGAYAQKIIDQPRFKFTNTGILNLKRIEMSDSVTTFHLTYQENPARVRLNRYNFGKNDYIQDVKTGKKYYPIGMKGAELDSYFYIPSSGTKEITVFYPKLDAGVTEVDLGADTPQNYRIYGISLTDECAKNLPPSSIMGTWMLADGSNCCLYAFTEQYAIIGNTFWTYEKVKQEKNYIRLKLRNSHTSIELYARKANKNFYQIGTQKKRLNLCTRELTPTIGCGSSKKGQVPASETNESIYGSFLISRVEGCMDGYDPRFGLKTVQLVVKDKESKAVKTYDMQVDETGYFGINLKLSESICAQIEMKGKYSVPCKVNKGQNITVFLDYKDILQFNRNQNIKDWYYKRTRFMGASGIENMQMYHKL